MFNRKQPYVRLLGRPEIKMDGDLVKLPAKAVGVLATLLDSRNGSWDRVSICELLWPRSPNKSARHSLSQTLYVISQALGPDAILTEGETLSVGEIGSDLILFRNAVSDGRWLDAANVYSGRFVEGLKVIGSPQFEHWVDQARASIDDSAVRVLEEITSQAHWKAAKALGSILLDTGVRTGSVVRAMAAAHTTLGGHRAARDFAALLEPNLREVADQAIAESEARRMGSNTGPDRTAFVGRASAMHWLEERLNNVADGVPTLALVTGEAGIGKTALIGRFSRLRALRGTKVLTACGYEAELNLPFGVVGQWLEGVSERDVAPLLERPWMSVLEAVFPTISGSTSGGFSRDMGEVGHHRLLESLRRFVAELASSRPLLLAIDDTHWADSASLSFVHYLLRRADDDPIMVVASVRSEAEIRSGGISDLGRVERLHLKGLTEGEIEELLASIPFSPSSSEPSAQELRHRTGGNPLLLTTLLREAKKSTAKAGGGPPESIVEFFRPRLMERTLDARRLLGALSVLEDESEVSTLYATAGLPPEIVNQGLGELKRAQLVDQVGIVVSLRHGLVGEIALSMLSEPERQRLYGRAARHMAISGSQPTAILAVSHNLAGNKVDAFEASVTASKACDVLHARAEKEFFLRLALSNAPTKADEARIRTDLAELYLKERRRSKALELLDPMAFAGAPTEVKSKAEITRQRIMAETTGDPDVLLDLWQQAKSLADGLAPLLAADTYTPIAVVAYDLGMDEIAADIAEHIEKGLRQLPLTAQTARRLLRPLTVISFRKGYEVGLSKFAELPPPEDGDPVYRALFKATKATVLVAAGRLAEAEDLFAASMGIIERFALFDHYHMVNNNLGVCLMEQGRFQEAEEYFNAALEYEVDTGPSQYSTVPDNLTILAYERGDYERALEMASSLLANRGVAGTRAVMSLQAIIGLSGLELGSLGRCREAERDLQMLVQRHDHYNNDMSYLHIFLARMTALRGEHQRGIELLAAAAAHYRSRNLLASARLRLEQCRLHLRQGDACIGALQDVREAIKTSGAAPLVERTRSMIREAARVHP